LLDLVNTRGGAADAEELRQHFHESFLAVILIEEVQSFLLSVAEAAPLTVEEQVLDEEGLTLRALVSSSEGPLEVFVQVDASTGLIVGLTIGLALDLETGRPQSWPEVDATVAGLAPEAQYLVASVGAGGCEPLHARQADTPLAIGSAFKLYVLAEAARQIDAGELSWDTEVTVRDALKSLPSGELQNVAEGTTVSVLQLAQGMIAISDNTATDHLLDRLGRDRVESVLSAAGHASPERNIPFLSTRELFLFKLSLSGAEQDSYLASDTAGRRAFLETLAGRVPELAEAEGWEAPRRIAELEWFASADDLCSVMAYLLQLSERPLLRPLLGVLALNPGLPIDPEAFGYVGFKGGSEPGVQNTTWLVQNRAAQWRFVSLTFNNAEAPIADERLTLVTALGMFDLLAAE
jgi:beta-lactamase class A